MITMNGTVVMEFSESELKYIDFALEELILREENGIKEMMCHESEAGIVYANKMSLIAKFKSTATKVHDERRRLWAMKKGEDDAVQKE